MGYRVLLVAVTGKDPTTIHNEYSVTHTNQYEEIPESPVTGATLPAGAYLLYINDDITPDDRVFEKLSKNGSLVACYANETVMNSFACAWENGFEKWSVFHDAQQGIKHLEKVGNTPEELKPIEEKLLTKQANGLDVDYVFNVPVELFVALGGIRYNEDIQGAGPEPWQVLTRSKQKKSWWPFR